MASRKIGDLHSSVRGKAVMFLMKCTQQGIQVIITCTLRTMKEQTALYAQGREPIAAVNTLRAIAGMPLLPETSRVEIVTNARPGFSMHNFGLAFDVVLLNAGKPIWNVSDPAWKEVGHIGKGCGLEWAGDWKTFKEYAHFQYTGGLTLAQIRAGEKPQEVIS